MDRSQAKNFFKFIKFVAPYKNRIVFIFICIFLYTLFNAISIGMIQPFFDYVLVPNKTIETHISKNEHIKAVFPELNNLKNRLIENVNHILRSYSRITLLKFFIIIILITVILKALFHSLYSYYSPLATHQLLRDLRNKLYDHLQVLPLDYFKSRKTGAIISHITNDVMILDDFINEGIIGLVLHGLTVILFTCILFYLNWKLAFFSIFVSIFTIVPIKILSQKLRRQSVKFQEKTGEISGIINESLSGIKVIKSYCGEKYEQEKFNKINHGITKTLIRAARLNAALIPLVEFMAIAGMVIVLFYGGKEIVKGELSGGQFILFLGAFLSLGNPLKKLSQIIGFIEQGSSAIDRIFSIIDLPSYTTKNSSNHILENIQKDICFKKINFRYSPDTYTLKDININVKKGEIIAIVGTSGAGKSTLMDLLPRFMEPETGTIEIDGTPIREFDIKSLRDKIGIVSQEVILFHDTIYNNIAYGKQNASTKEIEDAARMAYAHEFISELPEGYSTLIGERGSKLSGGQRQRVSIARAILKNPPILILDEATSNIDTQSEKLVQEALYNLMKGKTTFIIAHRFSSIKLADKVLVMKSGKIIAAGSHNELIENNEDYQYLWKLQEWIMSDV